MRITRETDYALRILRTLSSEKRQGVRERISIGEITKQEFIPQQFAYKIAKKLEKAGLVEITRGLGGGCRLTADLRKVSLYDLMRGMDEDPYVISCLEPGYTCQWREQHKSCRVHQQLARIQKQLDQELQKEMLQDILEE